MSIVDGTGENVPGHRPIDDTDLEISYNMRGDDLIGRVNKNGVMIFRVLLEKAAAELTTEELLNFSGFLPDFVFKIGDLKEGLDRLTRSIGHAEGVSVSHGHSHSGSMGVSHAHATSVSTAKGRGRT